MGKKQSLIDNCLYNEMRDFARETLSKYGMRKREISNYFDNYVLKLPSFLLKQVFGCKEIGVLLESYESEDIAVAALSQMEKPAGSSYNFDLAFVARPSADLRAPLIHGDAQDPMAGMKGMFSMDLYNFNPKDFDIDEFLGENVAKIKEALAIVEQYQKTVEQGRGKYTAYLEPYKSKYRVELVQPPAKDEEAVKKFYQDELECFKLFYEAYFSSLSKLEPESSIVQNNKSGFNEFIGKLLEKDFAAKTGKKMYKEDFPQYFLRGFWHTETHGNRVQPRRGIEGVPPELRKKGLILYNSCYGSTAEASYWVQSLIGQENHIEVKRVDQVISIKPFDYVIIGSHTRQEKPTKPIYEFVKKHHDDLCQKEVAYFLCCGDVDETQILAIPGGPKPHLIGGRNYIADIMGKFPAIEPAAIAGFGGRQVFPNLNKRDKIMVTMVGKLAKEGIPWKGLDIWESLVPERVETFANEIRERILGIDKIEDCTPYRRCWNSVQPATLADKSKNKFNPKPYFEEINTNRVIYKRARMKGSLDTAEKLFSQWAKQSGTELEEKSRTYFNIYYLATKNNGKKDVVIHTTAAEFPEDPGNVHFAFRCFGKPAARKGVDDYIKAAQDLFLADGRKID